MPHFISFTASIAELAHGKNRELTHSLTHSPSLFDVPATKALASDQLQISSVQVCVLHDDTHLLKW